ncbi:MAG: hypothetical protein J5835_02200 [Bacteroidales bacterium]|nr:hypothetical protein [Bacteroidales bacterium]
MKKVFMFAAVAAMMALAVACGNNNSKKAEKCAECEATEECCQEKGALEEAAENAADAVKEAATEKAVEAINAAGDKAVEAIKK